MEKRNTNEITLDQVKTVGQFVKFIKDKTGNDIGSNQAIHYHLNKTNELDFVKFCGMNLIIMNEKASKFMIGYKQKQKN